jgi:hypothetical protein
MTRTDPRPHETHKRNSATTDVIAKRIMLTNARTSQHLALLRDHPTEIDGYKPNHGYDGGPGGDSELTSTERAAEARLRGARVDEHSQATYRALEAESDLCDAWHRWRQALAAADAAQVNDEVPDVRHCQSCARAGCAIGDDTGDPLTWSGANLPTEMWLCEGCRRFVSKFERLPTVKEVSAWNIAGRKATFRVYADYGPTKAQVERLQKGA